MKAALEIAGSNVVRFARNRSFFIVAFLAPLAIMAALSSTVGAALSGEFRPSLVLADELDDATLDEVAASLRAAGFDDLAIVDSAAAARERVDSGDADAAIVFTQALSRSLADPTGDAGSIDVIADAEADLSAQVAVAIGEQSAREIDTIRILTALGAPADHLAGPFTLVDSEPVGSRVLTDGTYFAVGMSSYFAFFAASGFVATLHRERRESTLARMLVAPIPRSAPVIGKGLAAGAVALLSYATLVASSTILLGADWGPIIGTGAVGMALCFSAVGVAMAVASITRTEESAAQIGTVLATAWAIFGGVFLEISASGPLRSLSRLSPFSWTLEAIGLNAGSGSVGEVLARAGIIAIFGAVGLAIAVQRRAELGRI